jgi:tRNA dimethylallyltransferase
LTALTVIAGSTGAGKTALAMALAERIGAEIISADSQAVYRGFDIGTAKPSGDELARVPHHLVSVVDPLEDFSAVRWADLAAAAIEDVTRRGRRVIVAGGTGLYIRALLHGMVDVPVDRSVRAALTEEARSRGAEWMHARLAAVDPESAERLPATDVVRVLRALEIRQVTGQKASSLRDAHRFAGARYSATLWFLDPDREELEERLQRRTRTLFDRGLLEEVERLVGAGYRDAAPMRSVGYRQALAVVEGRMTREAAEAETLLETRRYAKRQRTWFRQEPGTRFVAPPYAEVLETAT